MDIIQVVEYIKNNKVLYEVYYSNGWYKYYLENELPEEVAEYIRTAPHKCRYNPYQGYEEVYKMED